MNVELLSRSPEETFAAGRRLGERLGGGEVVLLSGGLGAGKTLFAKGLVSALGFDVDEVNSPSFTLVNLYRAERADVYHIDLWRIPEQADAAAAVGLDEILELPGAVVIVEWPERVSEMESGRIIRVSIEGDGDDPRRITMTGGEAAD